MSSYPQWTPAAAAGLVPLHPLGFGTTLGRSFVALRRNPRVLLGFVLTVQMLVYILATLGIAYITGVMFERIYSLGTSFDEEAEQILIGSTVLIGLAGAALGVLSSIISTIVQSVVIVDVTRAVLAEKLTLRLIWQRIKPSLWRLLGYVALVTVAAAVGMGAAVLLAVLVTTLNAVAGVLFILLLIAGTVVLGVWLSTKLVLVPAIIIVEGAAIFPAVARSWRLIRGRFWAAVGIIVLIALSFGIIAQIISGTVSLIGLLFSGVFSPTSAPIPDEGIGIGVLVLSQGIILLIQAISVVVMGTATTLIYVDCRMRHEGLDQDLLGYVEQRERGQEIAEDPYLIGVGRAVATVPYPQPQQWAPPQQTPAPPPQQWAPAPNWAPPQPSPPPDSPNAG